MVIGRGFPKGGRVRAGDIITGSELSKIGTQIAAYTKIFEIQIPEDGEYRIKHSGSTAGAGSFFTRIYRNGVAIGVINTVTAANPAVDIFTEDIGGWTKGDLCQLYAHKNTTGTAYILNFTIGADRVINKNAPSTFVYEAWI